MEPIDMVLLYRARIYLARFLMLLSTLQKLRFDAKLRKGSLVMSFFSQSTGDLPYEKKLTDRLQSAAVHAVKRL